MAPDWAGTDGVTIVARWYRVPMGLSQEEYARLLALRTGLRRFLRWSEQQAEAAGLTPAQHQLLLAIHGHDDPRGPTVGEVADYLLLRHHSTVELVDRADTAGLVSRQRDPDDHRVVRLSSPATAPTGSKPSPPCTSKNSNASHCGSQPHGKGFPAVQPTHGLPDARPRTPPPNFDLARVYDTPPTPQRPVLVDRLWPRGCSKADAPFEIWLKDVAPSTRLRTWYGHVPDRFDQFADRYRKELPESPPDLPWPTCEN